MPAPVYEYKTVAPLKNYAGNDYPSGMYPSDNALALSAQKFHFQHEKEKLIAMENEKSQVSRCAFNSSSLVAFCFCTPDLFNSKIFNAHASRVGVGIVV